MSAAYWNGILRAHQQADRHRTVANNTATGWADDRMMRAYDLIWEVMKANESKGITPEFTALLRLIEAADEALIEGELA